jgi:hypothetical protein
MTAPMQKKTPAGQAGAGRGPRAVTRARTLYVVSRVAANGAAGLIGMFAGIGAAVTVQRVLGVFG